VSEATEVVAECVVKQSIEVVLVRLGLVPMPVSNSSSRSVPLTGRLVDVPRLNKDGEVTTSPRFIADKVVAAPQSQQTDPPATESYVKQVLVDRLHELCSKYFDPTTKILYSRASHLVAGDDTLATVEFVQKALASVFSPPSAESELVTLAAPFMLAGERLMAFFARTNVSASDLRTLSRAEIAQRILRREREIEVEKKEAEERKARCSQPQPQADSRDAYLNRMRVVAAQG
jgi:hypothetical protein